MGYFTEYVGQFSVSPPINRDEVSYLKSFAASRRVSRVSGPYATMRYSLFSRDEDILDANTPPPGQPAVSCQWEPTENGSKIEWNRDARFYFAAEWMEYLIDTFLRPGCDLQSEMINPVPGRFYAPEFSGFLFNHTVNGEVLAIGEEDMGSWRVIAESNVVRVENC